MDSAEAARIESCARSPFKNLRLHALERLLTDFHPNAGALLLILLGDVDPAVQVEAVRAAGALQCREALPRLLELLHSGLEPVALQAAVTLGELGHYGEPDPESPAPAATEPPPEAPLAPANFYVLFALLSLGIFLSGYLFRMEMEALPPPAPVSAP